MPSETMNFPGFFANDASLPSEINGFWKTNNLPNYYATGRTVARSPLEHIGATECQPAKPLEFYHSLLQDQKMNQSLGLHAVGTDKSFNHSSVMLRPMVHDPRIRSNLNGQQVSCYAEGGKADGLLTQTENGLFSHSLSESLTRLSSNNAPYDQSADPLAPHVEEEEPLESLEEIEAKTIGNLLPTDDDLFNEMTDKMNSIQYSRGKDDMDNLDVFSSLGGLDLGDDGAAARDNNGSAVGVSNGKSRYRNTSLGGEQPYTVHPSRTLFVRNIHSSIEDSELMALFEKYGDIQNFYTSGKHQGFAVISYYDIRAAMKAKQALQNVPLRHLKLDLHYSIPKDEDINQGALLVLNLDSSISTDELRLIFCTFGEIKEISEISQGNQHKYIEFYDSRAAEVAFRALNGSNIAGKHINLELSPTRSARCFLQRAPDLEQDQCFPYALQSSPCSISTGPSKIPRWGIVSHSMDDVTITTFASAKPPAFTKSAFGLGISSSVPNNLSSFFRVDSSTSQAGLAEAGQRRYDDQGAPIFHHRSLPDNYDDLKSIMQSMSLAPERAANRKLQKASSTGHLMDFDDGVFGSGSSSLTGHRYTWTNSHNSHSPGVIWSNSPPHVNGISVASPTEWLHRSSGLPSPVVSSGLPGNNHHVGSAPSGGRSLWERRRGYAGNSPDTSGFSSGSLGNLRVSDTPVSVDFVSPVMPPRVAGNYMELSIPPKSAGFPPHHQRSPMRSPLRSPLRSPMRSPIFPGRGQMSPVGNSFESPNERARSRRNEGSINPADKKQYELDLDRIMQGEDKRTTLMIKNIPNKYTSKMLLAAIDEHHRGTYDFIYLPIDFKNKCNVGYAFINMIDPCQIVPFYKAFNGKKWEKFNSEKIALIAYARIQGKAALIAHFQNSSLMNEDERCRPILFNTDGPNAGDQVPFPTGTRTRPPKSRTNSQENLLISSEESLSGDASSGSGRDSD